MYDVEITVAIRRGALQPIYAWATPSSQGTTTYETVLYQDGQMSCSCPGWVIKRAGKGRTCWHITGKRDRSHPGYAEEARKILAAYRAGRPIPAPRRPGATVRREEVTARVLATIDTRRRAVNFE